MKIISTFIIMLMLCTCSNDIEVDTTYVPDELSIIGSDYLELKEYEVETHLGLDTEYILSPEDIYDTGYEMRIWIHQEVNPEDYFGELIVQYGYEVSGHKFDNRYGIPRTGVVLLFVNNEVIGGISYPLSEDVLIGGPSQLDGIDFEDLHKMSYPNFMTEWREKYKPDIWDSNRSEKYEEYLKD